MKVPGETALMLVAAGAVVGALLTGFVLSSARRTVDRPGRSAARLIVLAVLVAAAVVVARWGR